MNEQNKEDQLVKEMKSRFGSDFIDDPIELCKFINEKVNPVINAYEKKDLLEAFEKLDTITENLPIFALGDNLSKEVRNNRLLYFAEETMKLLVPIIQTGIRTLDFSKIEISDKEKEIVKLLGIPDLNLLNIYFREWETQNALFIKPVYNNLLKKNLVQKRPNNTSSMFYIKALQEFFEKDKDLQPLHPLMNFLNADIRNSIVHGDFYIDSSEDRLYYFDRRTRPEPLFIEMSELGKTVILLYILRLVTCVLICRKIT